MTRTTFAFILSALVAACGDPASSTSDGSPMLPGDAAPPRTDAASAGGDAPAVTGLRAAIWEVKEDRTRLTGLQSALEEAGWEVIDLPMDRPADRLAVDLVVFGSFVSDDPRYRRYVAEQTSALRRFLERGGVVLQFTQATQAEEQPLFLPENLSFKRSTTDISEVFALMPEHPLVQNLAVPDRADHLINLPSPTPPSGIPDRPACWHCPHEQLGFSVIAAGRRDGEFPALMEGSSPNGEGRVLIAGLHLDKIADATGARVVDPRVVTAAKTFFKNLSVYVSLLRTDRLEPPSATAPYVSPAPTVFEPGSTSIIAFPDTQNLTYVGGGYDGPAIFRSQTFWANANLGTLSTAFLLNVGDIVERNNDAEWTVAANAFGILPATQPLMLSTGNHDHGVNGGGTPRGTKFDQYFPLSRFRAMPTFGGALDTAENSYHLIEINGQPWIALGMEWAPRNATLKWAKEVLAAHPDRRAIVVTHAYMYYDETRYDHITGAATQPWNPHWYFGATPEGADVNDGQEIWDKLIRISPNVRLVLSGHVAKEGLGRMASKNDAGIEVHQLAFNYQSYAMGGGGFLRIFEFLADKKTVRARTYSPYLDTYLTDSQNQFEFTVAP